MTEECTALPGLVNSALEGDERAFAELVERHQDQAFGVAYGVVCDPVAAQEIVQDSLISAWTHLGRLRRPEAFPMWLRMITRNLARNWLRSAGYRRRLAERQQQLASAHPHLYDSPEEAAAGAESRAAIRAALHALPLCVREAMTVYYLEGKSVADSARALNITEQAMRQRLKRGRAQLREHFEARWEEHFDEELEGVVPRKVAQRFLAGSALGPAFPRFARSSTGSGPALWWHHLVYESIVPSGLLLIHSPARAALLALTAVVGIVAIGASLLGRTATAPAEAPKTQAAAKPSVDAVPPSVAPAPQTATLTNMATPPAAPAPIPPTYTITGRVLEAGGDPLAGATVTAYTGRYDPADAACHVCLSSVMENTLQYAATSDNEGAYVIDGIKENIPVLLVAKAQGHATRYHEHVAPDGRAQDFTLDESLKVLGVVVDGQSGAPLSRFEARIAYLDTDTRYGQVPGDYPWQLFSPDDGAFMLDANHYRRVQVAVRAPGYAEFLSEILTLDASPANPFVAALNPGAAIEGRVLDGATGKAILGAMVGGVRGKVYESMLTQTFAGRGSVLTAADGRFVLDSIDAADAERFIGAWHRDYAPGFAPIPSGSDTTPIEIRLFPAGQSRFYITERGRPRAYFRVICYFQVGRRERAYRLADTTSDAGMVEIGGMPQGDYVVHYYDPALDTVAGAQTLSVRSGETSEVRFDLADSCIVRGYVAGAENPDALRVMLRPSEQPGLCLRAGDLEADGRYELEASQGDYELLVFPRNAISKPLLVQPLSLSAGETLDLNVELPAAN